MKRKCVAMFSGGLDSILVVKAMKMQGLEVIAFHGTSAFHTEGDDEAHRRSIAETCFELGADSVELRDMNRKMIAFTNSPCFGYGKQMNACLDCRLETIRTAGEVMKEFGADFIASGEVMGQRPMSQRKHTMQRIDKHVREMRLGGLLLRPLCAKLLEPTIPEIEGWVDREELFDFSGRNRKPQMQLAEKWGVTGYPSPAGGCLLTDGGYSLKLRDLMKNKPDWSLEDARLLSLGRHFRIGPETKIIVSRNKKEAELLMKLAFDGDTMFLTESIPGALVVVNGRSSPETENIAAALAVYYSKARGQGEAKINTWKKSVGGQHSLGVMKMIHPDTMGERHLSSCVRKSV